MKLEDYKNLNHHLFHFYNKRPSRHIFRINRKWSCSYIEMVKSWFIFKIMYVCTKSIIMKRLKHIFDTIILWFHKFILQNSTEMPFWKTQALLKTIKLVWLLSDIIYIICIVCKIKNLVGISRMNNFWRKT